MKALWSWLLLGSVAVATDKGPASAPVVIVAFADFGSPQGGRARPVLDELMGAYPGKIRLLLKHAPLSGATLAHEAALAAGAQGKFWEMHDLLYAHQDQTSAVQLKALAGKLGLDAAKFDAALREHKYLPAVERDLAEARALGLRKAPMYFVNGKAFGDVPTMGALKVVVNQALNLPAQVEITRAPARGPANAPITLVEFSDFQCGFCTRVLPTVSQLMKEYPNQIRWVFKHFPLDFHKEAPLAHEASLAAAAQGKFWEMHDLLFTRKTLKRDDMIGMARELGLDVARFSKELDSRQYRKAVEADRREGTDLGVEGTPTFFVNGKALVGAQPVEAFRKVIEAERKAGK